jgi:antitoxin ParD1/3/4
MRIRRVVWLDIRSLQREGPDRWFPAIHDGRPFWKRARPPKGFLGSQNIGFAPMNVSLTPELEKFVSTKVESRRYHSASEVVRGALRLLEERDSSRTAQLAEFNAELGRRLAALDRSETAGPAEARARLRRKSEKRRNTGA